MKKLNRRSKSGFTLLEVLLAVVILCIASTMIMKGFIAVMIFGRNNRNYNKSGAANYEAAMHEIATNAMANNWMDNQQRNAGNGYTSLTLSYDAGHAASVALPTIPVQVSSFSDGGPVFSAEDSNAYVIDGEEIDSSTTANNRFSFFYDFNDYMGSTGDHIYRWGFVFNPASGHPYDAAGGYITPVYCDKNGNGLVGDDEPDAGARSSELLGYGRYGWYCFNINHGHMEGDTYVPDTCRSTPRAGYPHD